MLIGRFYIFFYEVSVQRFLSSCPMEVRLADKDEDKDKDKGEKEVTDDTQGFVPQWVF